jgi:hypothetical protein
MLGYGSPSAASYRRLPIPLEMRGESQLEGIESCDYGNTFLDVAHVKEVSSFLHALSDLHKSFPGHEVHVAGPSADPPPPYRLLFRRNDDDKESIEVAAQSTNPLLQRQAPAPLR